MMIYIQQQINPVGTQRAKKKKKQKEKMTATAYCAIGGGYELVSPSYYHTMPGVGRYGRSKTSASHFRVSLALLLVEGLTATTADGIIVLVAVKGVPKRKTRIFVLY